MLKSMVPRSVCLFMENGDLRDKVAGFFIAQGWDVDTTGPNDMVVFDSAAGVAVIRSLRKRRDETPALFLRGGRLRLGRMKYTLAIEAPFTPDRLRDACGALLRRRIKLVLRRRAS